MKAFSKKISAALLLLAALLPLSSSALTYYLCLTPACTTKIPVNVATLSGAVSQINASRIVMLGGLSLQDRGRAPAYTTTGTTFRQFTNADPLHHALQRAKQVGIIQLNAGKSGSTSTDTLNALSVDVLNAVPLPGTYLYLQGGNNINLITGFSTVESVLATFASDSSTIYSNITNNGIAFGWEVLPDNGTWTGDGIAAALSTTAQQQYARSHAYWRMRRWQMEFARLTGSKYLNLAAGYTRDARQIPVSVTSNTISSTTTTASFVVPNAGANVSITMTSTASFSALDFVNIATAGIYQVVSVTDGTHLVATNYPITGNAASGVTIASSKNVIMGSVTTNGSHAYSTGNMVVNYVLGPSQQSITTPTPIHVTGATTFTYGAPATNTVTTQGKFQRTGVLEGLTADQSIHYDIAGAVKLSYAAEEGWVWNARDYMPESNADAENLVSVGLASTDHNILNTGMLTQGTAGSFTGGISSSSGTVPTGYTFNKIGGGGTDTVVGSIVAFTDPGRNQMSYAQFSITTGASEGHYGFSTAMVKPTAWQISHAYSLGDWMSPSVANGYYYVAVIAGTSASSEPTEQTTPGRQFTDGGVTWETRRAPFLDGTTQYHFMSDFQCVSGCSNLLSLSCGLFDDAHAWYLTDGDDFDDPPPVANYLDGDHRYLMTPDLALSTNTTTLNVGCRVWVVKNSTIVLNFARFGFYRAGFGQNSIGAI